MNSEGSRAPVTVPPADDLLSWYRRQHVVITGGSGAIGRELGEQLSAWRPASLATGGRVDSDAVTTLHRRWEITNPADVAAVVGDASVVFHLAGCKRADTKGDEECHRTNVDGTAAVVAACRRRRPVLVLASTAYVYRRTSRPLRECDELGPEGAYATSKLEAERLVRSYAEHDGGPALVARLSNVYGSPLDGDTVVSAALRQAAQGEIRLRDLRPVRDFLYVRDAAEALVRLARLASTACPIVNVGTGVGSSVAELARTIVAGARRFGHAPVLSEGQTTDPAADDQLVLDISRLRTLTGWAPTVALGEGLAVALQRVLLAGGRSPS